MKAKILINDKETPPVSYLVYMCPGCKYEHCIPVTGPKKWNFNDDLSKPTLKPSVRHYITFPKGTDRAGQEETICHYHIKEGRIEYCNDCRHALNGQKVELPEVADG